MLPIVPMPHPRVSERSVAAIRSLDALALVKDFIRDV
jgi:hypothetical protein